MQVKNAAVVKEEMSKVGEVKDVQTDGDVWQVKFENDILDFDTPWNMIDGGTVKQIYTQSDVKPNDTLVVNLTLELEDY